MRSLPTALMMVLLAVGSVRAAEPVGPAPILLAQAQLPADPGRVAAMQVRIQQLEEEIRRLTGRVEEAEYAQQQASQRLDRLIADIDARLSGMEAPPAAAAAGVAPPVEPAARAAAPAATGAPPAVAAAPSQAPLTGQDPAAARGYVLGTLPRDALTGGRSPQPAANAVPPRPSAALSPANAQPKLLYDAAFAQLQAGDFPGAQQQFASFLDAYPNDPLAANAAYWLAETYYGEKDYETAASLFAKNYQGYGKTAAKAPDNLLKLGKSLALIGNAAGACQSYAELEKQFPNVAMPLKRELARSKTASGCA